MKALKVLLLILVCLAVACLLVIGTLGPETYIYAEGGIPKRYLNKIELLGLLEEGETIKYFYSDGLIKITDGMYFVTDRNLTVYISDRDEPAYQLALGDIDSVTPQFDDSILTDSWLHVTCRHGGEVDFPLSSDKGRDKDFVNCLRRSCPLIDGGAPET